MFADFQMEGGQGCGFDYVSLFDGPTVTAPHLGRYCGSARPPRTISSTPHLLIVFKSDFNIGGRGFKAHFYSGAVGQWEGRGDRHWVGVVILSPPLQQREMIVGVPLGRAHEMMVGSVNHHTMQRASLWLFQALSALLSRSHPCSCHCLGIWEYNGNIAPVGLLLPWEFPSPKTAGCLSQTRLGAVR